MEDIMKKVELYNEEWKDVVGYENYEVSSYGNVRSKDRYITQYGHKKTYTRLMKGHQLKKEKLNSGYYVVQLSKNGKKKAMTVHRLVACAFLGENDLDVNHKDGKKENNCLENLEFVSRSANIEHSYRVLGKYERISKKVKCLESGEIFNSIREAGRAKNVNPISIGHVLAGRAKTAGGYTWKRE